VGGADGEHEAVVGDRMMIVLNSEKAPSPISLPGDRGGLLYADARCTDMQMVEADAESVEVRLQAGEIACADCGGELRPWGHARERMMRDHGRPVPLRPRRSRCRSCRGSHVLLPTLVLLRRVDLAAVIGGVLVARHVEGQTRAEVARAAGAPWETVRGWLRRFNERAAEIRAEFAALAHGWDAELGAIEPRGSTALDALEAIGVAAAAAVRRFGPTPLWTLVAGASGGRLLSNTSSPVPVSA
jgi:hypothetical protein